MKKYKGWAITKNGKLLSLIASHMPMGAELYLICTKKDLYNRTLRNNESGRWQRVEIKFINK